ncbi:MAG TPA: NRDE family protein [Bacteroidales bacterium]|nr:NRDE family protein [Bacteroidales bacterium]HRX95695.1 NRDE family protein [Bacteroidales bacterium]
MLSYIPLENGQYILTQNRDESIMRPNSTPPIKKQVGGVSVVYPVDPQGWGTWLGVSSAGHAAALINGGLQPHKHHPPYRHSRGLIIPAFLTSFDFEFFYRNYDFSDLEPFTMLLIDKDRLFEIIKTEDSIQLKEHDPGKPLFRLSYQLYPEDSINERSLHFYRWYYKHKHLNENEVLNYHLANKYELPEIPKNDTGKHILKTVSITQAVKKGNKFRMNFYDAVNDLNLFNSTKIDKPVGAPAQ